jgi:hypothetical protein
LVYIGNFFFQIHKIIKAPQEFVHKKTFYLADYAPIILRDFADAVQKRFGAKPIRTVPTNVMKTAARIGDICQALGWKDPPLTAFRYHNIVTNEIQDLTPLETITGPLPYTVSNGIEITVNWLKEFDNSMG